MRRLNPLHQWRAHPWHGLGPGEETPDLVTCFIEMTPFDLVKYEIDKENGYLRVDRPQRSSAVLPALYGFVPQTFCAERVADLSPNATAGDGDPLDICVISERPIQKSEILLTARVIGGLQMVDDSEADDKIVAVLANDDVWGGAREIEDIPAAMVERLHHYFSTYKLIRGRDVSVSIDLIYGADHARRVVEAALADYDEHYGV
ncbi:MAG: inorganic pyrophosphatase [Acidimicrobiia bacterium]|nr:inorganic pyrophosphatase [Acidimicrobiia bacterium]MDH4306914.1 inorganic pyrophosphatase [Acidimicrobiia bacterium]MDH5292912.1 inorganic pyrophosphatase [Acidimicrobiia bacterium]